MKQPTAPTQPNLYPELPTGQSPGTLVDDGQNYRLQKISEIEKILITERDFRKGLYKKYKRWINFTDGVDTTLISSSIIIAGVGITTPILLPLEVIAAVCGTLGVCVKFIRRRLSTKSQKHYEIKTMAKSKLNTIKDLISKALNDGQISEGEFKLILDELEKYNNLKDEIHSKNNDNKNRISDQEKKKLIEEGKAQAMNEIKKKMGNL